MTTIITTLSVLVENNPGVLARIASLFARRSYNIQSLSVGPTEREDLSRMTIVASTPDEAALEQITKQLNKLVEVIKVTEMTKGRTVRRELVLVKVCADTTTRQDILSLTATFRGKVVDVAADSVIVEVTGKYGKVRAFLDMIGPYGIIELVQSGQVALARGSRAITDKTKDDRKARNARPQK